MGDWTGTILQFLYGGSHLSTHLHQHTHVPLHRYLFLRNRGNYIDIHHLLDQNGENEEIYVKPYNLHGL